MGRVNLVQPMGRDTVNMADAFVYPWPSKERFKKEFLALGLPNQGLDPAWDSNMDPMDMYDRLIEVGRDGQSTPQTCCLPKPFRRATRGKLPLSTC